jgi:hypothetical protein
MNHQYLVGPSAGSEATCFDDYVQAPGFPLVTSDLLREFNATFGGVVQEPLLGVTQTVRASTYSCRGCRSISRAVRTNVPIVGLRLRWQHPCNSLCEYPPFSLDLSRDDWSPRVINLDFRNGHTPKFFPGPKAVTSVILSTLPLLPSSPTLLAPRQGSGSGSDGLVAWTQRAPVGLASLFYYLPTLQSFHPIPSHPVTSLLTSTAQHR